MRFVVEVTGEVERRGEIGLGLAYRIFEGRADADAFYRLAFSRIADGRAHRSPTGAEVTPTSCRLFEAGATENAVAKAMVRVGKAKLIKDSQETSPQQERAA